jgi:hypothetical protein
MCALHRLVSYASFLTVAALIGGTILLSVGDIKLAYAEIVTPLEALPLGSSMAFVAGSVGSPSMKVERETKREEEWIYTARGSVIFHEGSLASIHKATTHINAPASESEDSPLVELGYNVQPLHADAEGATEEFLREVATAAAETAAKPSSAVPQPPGRTFPGMPPRP